MLSFGFAIFRQIEENRAAKKTVASNHLKNIRNFVCAASLLLAVWLGLTFVNDVPPNRYPTLGKGSVVMDTAKKSVAAVPVR